MTHTTNPTVIIGIAVFIASFSLVHLSRTWQSMRTRVNFLSVISFTRMQRIMHWTIGIGCAALVVTGLPVYLAQFLVNPAVTTPFRFFYWGFQVVLWRTVHIYLALLIVLVVLIHSLWDVYRVGAFGKIMRVSRADFDEARGRVRKFLGLSKDESSELTAQYDFFHKAFHWTLIGLGAFLLVSGLTEWEAIQVNGVPVFLLLDRINHTLMDGFLRTGHLVAAMLFAGMVALHIYFAILPQNRPFLRAIALGSSRARSPSELDSEPAES